MNLVLKFEHELDSDMTVVRAKRVAIPILMTQHLGEEIFCLFVFFLFFCLFFFLVPNQRTGFPSWIHQ